MSEDRGGTAACGSKKPISVKGSRPERQGKKKRLLSMKEKGEVLKKLDTGMGPVAVGNFFNISESTVRGIRAKRIEIQRFLKDARGSSVIEVAHITHPTSKLMVTTEHYLKKYIEDKNDRNVCISSAKAREKAREIYAAVARKLTIDNPPPFSASSGWFSRFKKRHSLKRARCLGEAADAPTHEVESFTDVLKQLIEGGGYDLRQIFNADETGFHWKQQPRSTIIAKQKKPRGHKESKQRFSVLFTVNATGDCKLKPLVLYTAARPRPYRHKDMKNLNVHWVSNKKGYMTTVTFLDWFDNHFIPEGKEYCERNNLAFKLMLLLDNAPGHPTFLRGRHPNCEVVFLPPNTTSIIQPLDQEIIANVKLEFYRRTWKKLEEALDTDDILLQVEEEIDEPDQQTGDPSAELQVEEEIDEPDKQTGDPSAERQLQVDDVHVSDEPYGQTGVHPQAESAMPLTTAEVGAPHHSQTVQHTPDTTFQAAPPGRPKQIMTAQTFFCNFNIKKAVDLMVECWHFVNIATVKHGWRKVLPWVKTEMSGGDRQRVAAAMDTLLQVAKTLPITGYENVSVADMEVLIDGGVAERSAEDMIDDEEADDEEEEEKEKKDEPTVQQLTEIFAITEKLKEAIYKFDSNSDRRETCIHTIQKGLNEYKLMYETRVNNLQQALITRYLRNRDKREDMPPAVVAEHDDGEDNDLLVDNEVAPENLGDDFEGFVLADQE